MTYEDIRSAWRTFMQAASESRANYWASYVTDFACIFLFAYLGLREPSPWPFSVVSWIGGFALFSLAEYAIHRWLLHNPKNSLFPLHAAHHKNPGEPAAFLFPTSVVVLTVIWLLMRYGLRYHEAAFLISGFAAGYSYYGVLHHVEHTTRINQIPFRWLQKRWAAHSVHHHLDEINFGVSTSFWDHVFGTQLKQGKRRTQTSPQVGGKGAPRARLVQK